jgi:hypothetical protein
MFQNLKFILSIICLVTMASPAVAQSGAGQSQPLKPMADMEILPDLKQHKKTNPEVVIFTQYKLSKNLPNIDEFAKLSPRVAKAQEIDKSAVTIAEYNRMSNRYNMMDVNQPIVVHTTLELDEYSSLQDLIVFDELNEKTYFNFPVYKENIAVIPKNVARFNSIKISKSAAEKMFKAVGNSRDIIAEFVLIPEYADRKTPFTMNNVDYWLMLGKIAELRLWSSDKENPKLVWFYRSPTYKPEDNKALDTLFIKETPGS